MPREIRVIGPRQVALRAYEDAPLKPDEVRGQGILSGISHGTEMNLYRGTSAFADHEFDMDLRLFVPRKGPAPAGEIGYEWVGRLTEVGADVHHLIPGDLVHMLIPHRDTQTFVPENFPYRGRIDALPVDVTPEQAIILALAGVALAAIHDARIKVGDRVAIFGLGAIGLLAVQLARLAGAGWIDAIDLYPVRRELATRFGADRTLDPGRVRRGLRDQDGKPSSRRRRCHRTLGALRGAERGDPVRADGRDRGCRGLLPGRRDRVAAGRGVASQPHHHDFHHGVVGVPAPRPPVVEPAADQPGGHRSVGRGQARTRTASSATAFPFDRAAEAYELIDRHPDEVIKVVMDY